MHLCTGVETHVGNTNGLGLAGGEDGLHLAPGLEVAVVADNVALAVGQLGETVVGAVGVHKQGPVHEEQVNIVQTQALERLGQALLDAGRVGGPDLGDDKDVLALDALGERRLQTLADLVLVAIAVGAVDEAVAVGDGVLDGGGDLTGGGLPGACAVSRSTDKESECEGDLPKPRAGISAPVLRVYERSVMVAVVYSRCEKREDECVRVE